MIRFHLDQHVPGRVAKALRRRGVDVTTTAEAGLQDAGDPEQLDFAHRERRVLITHDRDFLVLDSQGVPHAGICYCHPEARTTQQIVERLMLLHESYDQDEMIGRVEFL